MVNKNLIELDSHYLVSQVNSIKFYSGFNLRENDSHALNENKNNLILCKNLQQNIYKTGMASNKITARKRSDYNIESFKTRCGLDVSHVSLQIPLDDFQTYCCNMIFTSLTNSCCFKFLKFFTQ